MGTGEGETYPEALAAARTRLCEEIRVEVSSSFVSKQRSKLSRVLLEGGVERRAEDLDETEMIEHVAARCVFAVAPIREVRAEVVSRRHFVAVSLDAREYADMLASRSVELNVEDAPPAADCRAVEVAVTEFLAGEGYPVRRGCHDCPYRAQVRLALDVGRQGPEGVLIGSVQPSLTLVRASDSRVVRTVVAATPKVERAFSKERLMTGLVHAAADALRSALSTGSAAGP